HGRVLRTDDRSGDRGMGGRRGSAARAGSRGSVWIRKVDHDTSRTPAEVKLLDDTCVLIWLATGEKPLPDHVRSALTTGEVSISAATAWEIAIKYAKGLLPLVEPPERFVARVRKSYAFASLPIDEESALN